MPQRVERLRQTIDARRWRGEIFRATVFAKRSPRSAPAPSRSAAQVNFDNEASRHRHA